MVIFMKKMVTIFILIVGLVTGITVTARADLPTVAEYTYGSGTTEWTDTTSVVDDWSLQLNDPGNTISFAGVLITNLGDPTVADFSGWDYWTKGPQFFGVNVRMWLDTPYDNYPGESWDVALNVMPYNTLFYEGGNSAQPIPGDTWVNLDSETRYPYQFFAWDNTGTYLGGHDIATQSNAITWSEFQGLDPIFAHVDWGTWDYTYDFSEAIIKKISIRMGGGGHVADHTGYLDDFTLNGIDFILENDFTVVPVPGAVLLGILGLSVAGIKLRKHA